LHDATATLSSLASVKSRMVLPFGYWLTQEFPEKNAIKGCSDAAGGGGGSSGGGSGSSRSSMLKHIMYEK